MLELHIGDAQLNSLIRKYNAQKVQYSGFSSLKRPMWHQLSRSLTQIKQSLQRPEIMRSMHVDIRTYNADMLHVEDMWIQQQREALNTLPQQQASFESKPSDIPQVSAPEVMTEEAREAAMREAARASAAGRYAAPLPPPVLRNTAKIISAYAGQAALLSAGVFLMAGGAGWLMKGVKAQKLKNLKLLKKLSPEELAKIKKGLELANKAVIGSVRNIKSAPQLRKFLKVSRVVLKGNIAFNSEKILKAITIVDKASRIMGVASSATSVYEMIRTSQKISAAEARAAAYLRGAHT